MAILLFIVALILSQIKFKKIERFKPDSITYRKREKEKTFEYEAEKITEIPVDNTGERKSD